MPLKLYLDNLPEHFKLVSVRKDGREAIVSYPTLTTPAHIDLFKLLSDATGARSVGVLTPFPKDGSMHIELLAARGKSHDLGFQ